MQYHIVLTERCNLSCTYCGGTRHLPDLPLDRTYDVSKLRDFIGKDPDPVIGFYGGEPLLAMDLLEEIMDGIPARAFNLQTNGTGLSSLKDGYLDRLDSILVSLDGGREITDRRRGEGTFDLVMENLRDIRRRGYEGDLIARMAVSKDADIHRDVTYLMNSEDPRFDHVHWQLDVFWSDLDSWEGLEGWLRRYEEGISKLLRDFSDSLCEGIVPGMVPFIPVLDTLISGEPVPHIRCGAGMDSFAVMTSGKIEACPVAPELLYSNVGDVRTSTPQGIENSVDLVDPCPDCDIRWVCGGRCLYANRTQGWGRDWYDRICSTTRHMISELEKIVPLARDLVDKGVLSEDAFRYPTMNNGCEIIP
ncbi:MAG: TIGR04084 family radical SAM/SPASM domain-containing protein [Thermoplasmatota archaeon]